MKVVFCFVGVKVKLEKKCGDYFSKAFRTIKFSLIHKLLFYKIYRVYKSKKVDAFNGRNVVNMKINMRTTGRKI